MSDRFLKIAFVAVMIVFIAGAIGDRMMSQSIIKQAFVEGVLAVCKNGMDVNKEIESGKFTNISNGLNEIFKRSYKDYPKYLP